MLACCACFEFIIYIIDFRFCFHVWRKEKNACDKTAACVLTQSYHDWWQNTRNDLLLLKLLLHQTIYYIAPWKSSNWHLRCCWCNSSCRTRLVRRSASLWHHHRPPPRRYRCCRRRRHPRMVLLAHRRRRRWHHPPAKIFWPWFPKPPWQRRSEVVSWHCWPVFLAPRRLLQEPTRLVANRCMVRRDLDTIYYRCIYIIYVLYIEEKQSTRISFERCRLSVLTQFLVRGCVPSFLLFLNSTVYVLFQKKHSRGRDHVAKRTRHQCKTVSKQKSWHPQQKTKLTVCVNWYHRRIKWELAR